MAWLGLIALLVVMLAAQELFLETHRRYGHWRSTRERRFGARQDERRLMLAAITHRDPDPRVERTRLALVGVVLLVIAGFILLGPAKPMRQ